jgi:hypothetical protein
LAVDQRPLPWDQPGWLHAARRWIATTLERRGARVLSFGEVDTSPWSALIPLATTRGDVWFKASAPAEAFEPAVTEILWRRHPDLIPEVLAVDAGRAWMLTAAAGATLRELDAARTPARWEEMLRLYAALQIGAAPSVADLLAAGAPDRRPGRLVPAYEDVLARLPIVLRARHALSKASYASLGAFTAQIPVLESRLDARVPLSVAHEEVHDNNVVLDRGRLRFIDWAEAGIAHPFAGVTGTFRVIRTRFELEPGGPELLRFRDAYLEPWTQFAPLSSLATAFDAGYVLGMVCRILTWGRILDERSREEDAHGLSLWVGVLLDAVAEPAVLGA